MALVPDQKFSTFDNGGDLEVGDIIVGLRGGLNTRFTYTGELPVGVIIPIANGGTGANNAADARTNLGLGSMAVQDASGVAITGGTIAGVSISTSTAALLSGSVAATPSAGTDIANKDYVDSVAGGLVDSVNGTLNRITVDNTDPANPIVDIASTYVGQTSITTLGTIGTGTWQGTPIDLASYVSGNLAVTHLNSGTGASATTFWRGDGAWAVPDNGITPSALTRVDDTNVTLTLGGTPATALLQAVSITAGWTGLLAINRGGTGVGSVTTAPTASAWAGWDANSNFSANALIEGFATTVTAAGTTTLTVASKQVQEFTGSTTQTLVLPVASTLVAGMYYDIINNSSGNLTVNSSGGNLVLTMAANTSATIVCVLNSGTTAASWNASYFFDNGAGVLSITGTANQVIASASTGAVTLSLPQSIATSSAVQFASVQFSTNNGLLDANGNTLMNFSATASAVNYVTLINAATGNTPVLAAAGSNTNIALTLQGKGNLGIQLLGMTSGGAAPTGYTGEIIRGDNTGGSAMTTATPLNITSISLTAGNWDLYGVVTFEPTGNPTLILAGISTTSATTGATNTFSVIQGAILANTQAITAPVQSVSISSTTTYYLIGQANFAAGTCTGYGNLIARRRI